MMRGFAIIALIMLIGLAPTITSAAMPKQAVQPVDLIENESPDQVYPLVLAAGAVAGVMSVAWLVHGDWTIPFYVGVEPTAATIPHAAAAASRIFVITSGVLGVWIADILYR